MKLRRVWLVWLGFLFLVAVLELAAFLARGVTGDGWDPLLLTNAVLFALVAFQSLYVERLERVVRGQRDIIERMLEWMRR